MQTFRQVINEKGPLASIAFVGYAMTLAKQGAFRSASVIVNEAIQFRDNPWCVFSIAYFSRPWDRKQTLTALQASTTMNPDVSVLMFLSKTLAEYGDNVKSTQIASIAKQANATEAQQMDRTVLGRLSLVSKVRVCIPRMMRPFRWMSWMTEAVRNESFA